jgi:hypothetical protein
VRRQKSMRSGRISCKAAARDPESNVNRWNSRRTGLSRPANSKNHPFKSLIPIPVSRRFSSFQSIASAGFVGRQRPVGFASVIVDSSQRTHAAIVNAGDVLMALAHRAYTGLSAPFASATSGFIVLVGSKRPASTHRCQIKVAVIKIYYALY